MMMNIPAGTVIIQEGESNMDMYKIISGHAEIYTGYGTEYESILAIKSKDDYFGEMGLFTGGKPAVYTVVAYSDLLLMRITEADIDEFILKNHVDVYKIMKHFAETMYSMKFGMDMVMEDRTLSSNNARLKKFSGFYTKMFAQYNATMMMDPMANFNQKA